MELVECRCMERGKRKNRSQEDRHRAALNDRSCYYLRRPLFTLLLRRVRGRMWLEPIQRAREKYMPWTVY